MSGFSVKLVELGSAINEIKDAERSFADLQTLIDLECEKIPTSIKKSLNIGNRLKNAASNGSILKTKVSKSADTMYLLSEKYFGCEKKVVDYEGTLEKHANYASVADEFTKGCAEIVEGIDWGAKIGSSKEFTEKIVNLFNMPISIIPKGVKEKIAGLIALQDRKWLNKLMEYNKDGVIEDSYLHSLLQFKDDKTGNKIDLIGEEGKYSFGLATGSLAITSFIAKVESENYTGYLLKKKEKIEYSAKAGYNFSETNDKINKKIKDSGLSHETESDYNGYYKDGKKIDAEDAPDFYKKQATLFEFGLEGSKSSSLFEDSWEYEYGKVESTVGKAEAHAFIKAGGYVVGKDGKRYFSPGVSAEVGASYTALELSADGHIGDEMLGLDGKLTFTAGKAEGKVGTNIILKDENGNYNPQISGEFSVEAIAGEVEGKIGLNVLGGEVNAKASVNVGVGAHAKVGFKNGVFKVDIGASLGLGFSLKADINVGGMVNTVVGKAKSAWKWVKSLF